MEIILNNSGNLEAVTYFNPKNLKDANKNVVRYICYTDPNGNGFLKGKGDWKPFDLSLDEIEECLWVNISPNFIGIFEKAQEENKILYLEDIDDYIIENENAIL